MLGCASEHLLLTLADEIVRVEADATRKAETQRFIDGPALPLLRHLNDRLENWTPPLPRKQRELRDTTFTGIAHLIRITRNDAGHPHLQPVSREDCFVNLRLFVRYRMWTFEAAAHIATP